MGAARGGASVEMSMIGATSSSEMAPRGGEASACWPPVRREKRRLSCARKELSPSAASDDAGIVSFTVGVAPSALAGGSATSGAAAGCAAIALFAVQEELPPTYMFTLVLNVLWLGLTVQSFGHIANYYDITRTNTGLLMGVGNTFGKPYIYTTVRSQL